MKYFKDLTKFEFGLWIVSAVVVTVSFLLVPNKDILSLLASLIGVTALIFVSKGYVLGQILFIAFALFYGIISIYFKYYGEMITYFFMSTPMAICVTIEWYKNPYKESKEVTVNSINRKQIVTMIVLSAFVTFVFYFILKAMGTANLLFSTISIATSFIAAYLTYLRSPYYAIGYCANDIVLIVLWILASIKDIAYIPMIFCFIMFFANDIYGFINWTRMKEKQTE
ncbi:MAG: nicotinamide mononucleotide transporter [Clostridia bacterium]|nr:nicotinamide mononucleotide transporter [Clostridia bacterium]